MAMTPCGSQSRSTTTPQCARALVEAAGLNAAGWEARQRARDVANVERFGMSPKRFPTSCVEALEELGHNSAAAIPWDLRDAVWNAAESVFARAAPLVDGARAVLAELHQAYALALVTKGDADVQAKRIADSRLRDYFAVIDVVPHKDADTFRHVRATLSAEEIPCWSVGNSLSSDVLPAIRAGLGAVWVDAHVWEYEQRAEAVPEGVLIASSLREIPSLLRRTRTANAN